MFPGKGSAKLKRFVEQNRHSCSPPSLSTTMKGVMSVLLKASASLLAVLGFHFLNERYHAGFLLVAAMGTLRAIINPAEAFLPIGLMLGMVGSKTFGSDFLALAFLIALTCSLFDRNSQHEDIASKPDAVDVSSPIETKESEVVTSPAVVSPVAAAEDMDLAVPLPVADESDGVVTAATPPKRASKAIRQSVRDVEAKAALQKAKEDARLAEEHRRSAAIKKLVG